MEKINIAEKLKNCPKGFELYSKIHGNVKLKEVLDDVIYITSSNYKYDSFIEKFNKYGIYNMDFLNGECLLFPSKEQQDWNKFRYIEERHRVMCSDLGIYWYLKEYYKDNETLDLEGKNCTTWAYIVPVEDFDFQAKNISDNTKKSIV